MKPEHVLLAALVGFVFYIDYASQRHPTGALAPGAELPKTDTDGEPFFFPLTYGGDPLGNPADWQTFGPIQ